MTEQLQAMKLASRPMTLPAAPDSPIWTVWMSQHRLPCAIASHKLGLFSAISKHRAAHPNAVGATLDDICAATSLPARGAQALLDVACAEKFVQRVDGAYLLSPSGSLFLSGSGDHDWSAMLSGDSDSEAVEKVIQAVRDGKAIGAAGEWENAELSAERAESLTAAFHAHSLSAAAGCAALVPLKDLGITKLLDVGGGSGVYSIAFVRANPDVHACVMDLPVVCKIVERYADDAGVGSLVSTHPADMFKDDTWPGHARGFDGVFLSNILHDWDDDQCAGLLRRAHTMLPEGGKILLHEMLIADNRDGPLDTVLFSMHMVIYTRGVQRSFAELKSLLEAAGFTGVHTRPAHNLFSVVVASRK